MQVRVYDPVPGRPGEPSIERSFEIRPVGEGRFELALKGRFGGRWADALFRGIALAGIDVVRGLATRDEHDEWSGAFTLRRPDDAEDPLVIDYLALATRPVATGSAPFALTGFTIHESPRHGGSLQLDVRGPDRVGFLGGLLERLAFLTLSPVEMRVGSGAEGVEDRLYVVGSEGHIPGPRTRETLEAVLSGTLLR